MPVGMGACLQCMRMQEASGTSICLCRIRYFLVRMTAHMHAHSMACGMYFPIPRSHFPLSTNFWPVRKFRLFDSAFVHSDVHLPVSALYGADLRVEGDGSSTRVPSERQTGQAVHAYQECALRVQRTSNLSAPKYPLCCREPFGSTHSASKSARSSLPLPQKSAESCVRSTKKAVNLKIVTRRKCLL